jgi:hypothetical protein
MISGQAIKLFSVVFSERRELANDFASFLLWRKPLMTGKIPDAQGQIPGETLFRFALADRFRQRFPGVTTAAVAGIVTHMWVARGPNTQTAFARGCKQTVTHRSGNQCGGSARKKSTAR